MWPCMGDMADSKCFLSLHSSNYTHSYPTSDFKQNKQTPKTQQQKTLTQKKKTQPVSFARKIIKLYSRKTKMNGLEQPLRVNYREMYFCPVVTHQKNESVNNASAQDKQKQEHPL